MEPPPSMKRPANTAILDSDSPHSAVYIAARAEWNERYGSYIAQAHAWRSLPAGLPTCGPFT